MKTLAKQERIEESGDFFAWVERFEMAHGHPPRVLHVGNVANNGYLNAKILRGAGIECYVLCNDYYHIMGCPEWEDADLAGSWGDDFSPRWHRAKLGGFKRPNWFVQGPFNLSTRILTADLDGARAKAAMLRQLGRTHNWLFTYPRLYSFLQKSALASFRIVPAACYGALSIARRLYAKTRRVGRILRRQITGKPVGDEGASLRTRDRRFLRGGQGFLEAVIRSGVSKLAGRSLSFGRVVAPRIFESLTSGERADLHAALHRRLRSLFETYFPHREDPFEPTDVVPYLSRLPAWQALAKRFDLIHAYALEGVFPLLIDIPYVAYEHGTIRQIPFEVSGQGRLCALTYRAAEVAFITNSDNIAAAQRLELDNYCFVPHPVNEDALAEDDESRRLARSLRQRLDADFIVFHPPRQHWDDSRHPDWEKGNDIFIKGFARSCKESGYRVGAVFVDWGHSVEQSKQLLRELGVDDRVLWIRPQPNRSMIRYIYACDLLADQFFLGAFGSTMPKALACGRPAMLYLDEAAHKWCFSEMPPVLNARTPDQVFRALNDLWGRPEHREKLRRRGLDWYRRFHSNKVIVKTLINGYCKAIEAANGSGL